MKTKRLIDELRASEPLSCVRSESWSAKLRRTDPKLMAEIDEIIELWIAQDAKIRRVCESRYALAKWLGPKVGRKECAIIRYIDERQRGNS